MVEAVLEYAQESFNPTIYVENLMNFYRIILLNYNNESRSNRN